MLIAAFAFDYDGTLARDGKVEKATLLALRRVKAGGRKTILVTGRELPDLKQAFPQFGEFDALVAENGALLYLPPVSKEHALGLKRRRCSWTARLRSGKLCFLRNTLSR